MKLIDQALVEALTANATRSLLAAGANPNAQDEYGAAPLHMAHDAEQTRLLLAAGAHPDCFDASDAHPLHFARSVAQARALLAAGARIPDDLAEGEQRLVEQAEREQVAWLVEHELQPRADRLAGTPLPVMHPRRRA